MRKKIAVLFGGRSPEYSVSLQSAHAVLTNMDRDKFEPLPLGITQEGVWYLYTGPLNAIAGNTWSASPNCIPAAVIPGQDRLHLIKDAALQPLVIDAAFPVLHGQNGEDGSVQGLLQLTGIPIIGCGVLASALCMDKDRAHRLAHTAAGVPVPDALVLTKSSPPARAEQAASKWGYPVFVKPVRAGSSYGITRVTEAAGLPAALEQAFSYDSRVIIEKAISGIEIGCAVLGNDVLTAGEPDEIELSEGFFNYTEKYTLQTSAIHVPARITPQQTAQIKESAKAVYRALGCEGFARVDFFLEPSGRIVFNEVNTIPGFTAHSRYPNMMKAAGVSFQEVITKVIELAVKA